MQFPLTINFKHIALATQLAVRDATGAEMFYVKQQMFKLKENVEIYQDSSKTTLIGNVKADRVIDFSPLFTYYDTNGAVLGTIKRNGRRSLFSASYTITIGKQPFANVKESNPWTKVLDALFSELPIIGLFSGYVFQPKYDVTSVNGGSVAVLDKKPAFLEGLFELNGTGITAQDEQTQKTFAILMMITVLLERTRG